MISRSVSGVIECLWEPAGQMETAAYFINLIPVKRDSSPVSSFCCPPNKPIQAVRSETKKLKDPNQLS